MFFVELLDRLGTVVGNHHTMRLVFKEAQRQFLIDRVVLDEQDVEHAPAFHPVEIDLKIVEHEAGAVRPSLADQLQGIEHIARPDRLDQMRRDLKFAQAHQILALVLGGQHHQQLFRPPGLPPAFRQGKTEWRRHRCIGENVVVRKVDRPRTLDRRERRDRISQQRNLNPQGLKHLLQMSPSHGIVFKQQGTLALETHIRRRLCRRNRFNPETRREEEGRTLARLALQPDPAIHQLDKTR